MKLVLPVLCLLALVSKGLGRDTGWRSHVAFRQLNWVSQSALEIGGAANNGIFTCDRNGTVKTTLTRADGLSASAITAFSCHLQSGLWLAGHEDGTLDLVRDGLVTTMPDIARKTGLPRKTILRIVCNGQWAFACCAFGIAKIDPLKGEVAETWMLGTTMPAVYDLSIQGTTLWAASSLGIFRADSRDNLSDYRSWHLQNIPGQQNATFTAVAASGGATWFLDRDNDRLLSFDGTAFRTVLPEIRQLKGLRASGNGMIVLCEGKIWLYNQSGIQLIDHYGTGSGKPPIEPGDALSDENGNLWVADTRYGLTERTPAGSIRQVIPGSPASNKVTALKSDGASIFAGTVHTSADGSVSAFVNIFQDGTWQNLGEEDDPGLAMVEAVTSFAFPPGQAGEFWASTAGTGLLSFRNYRVAGRYDQFNSALKSLGTRCYVTGLASDRLGNLFYTNPSGSDWLGFRQPSGTFNPLPYPGTGYSGDMPKEIIPTTSGINWAILPGEGVVAFKVQGNAASTSDDLYRKISVQSRFTNATVSFVKAFSTVTALAEDLYQQLWVGTNNGVVVYTNPEKVFDPATMYGIQPSLDNAESVFKPILDQETVTAIAVDGANRKWIGTAGSGIFLFSAQGTNLLKHFDVTNSPLPSNQINAIAIVHNSGEVFIAAEGGLVSYLGDATGSSSGFGNAYAWPNPVRETFEGHVTIDGLSDGTDVRITDIAGNLLYRTSSLGGRATWDIRNDRGTRVPTGVYLVFCQSEDQAASKIIKLLVIH